ncbi:hypothetical protein V6N11_032412 [Hibiscus sabdariffa]|uniref:Uncharacterized protein n=1 Tax=Hibiscus sabdariffa TaxID=183260 RepID=A0ABR2T1C2_9ROSI
MVKHIATLQAQTLDRLRHWGRHSTFDGSYDPRTTSTAKSDEESMEWMMCDGMKAELAMSRARETNRDLEITFMETIDPAIAGTDGVKIEEEEGGACGMSQRYGEGRGSEGHGSVRT